MFTIEQIKSAHAKVKTGADYPKYIQDIKDLGVSFYETAVSDSNTIYHDNSKNSIASGSKYEALTIADNSNKEKFEASLKAHQRGESDFLTFCNQCAETGIEKWIADLNQMTCSYYDKAGNTILVETIPSV